MTFTAHTHHASVVLDFRKGHPCAPAHPAPCGEEPESPARLLLRALDALDDGVIVTTRSAVVHANRAARAILASGFLTVRGGRLCAAAAGGTRELQEAIAAGLAGAPPRILWLGAGGACRRVAVSGADVAPGGAIEATVTVVIRGATEANLPPERMVQAVFDLTPAEAKLAQEIVRGDGLKACARRLGVSANTVRTHLKHVFDKTGTRRQAELVRLLLSCRC